MSYEDKILDKFADMIMPPGTIIAYQGIEAPEGFIVYDHIKIYEDEFPRLYPVLAANPNFNKGEDPDGRKWVELPEIEDLCIQMTTDTSQVGKTLEAQLPNTTGSASFNSGAEGSMASALRGGNSGVFVAYNSVEKGYSPGSDQATTYRNLSFDLSRVSSIYSGSKMQSKALQTLPCIKF